MSAYVTVSAIDLHTENEFSTTSSVGIATSTLLDNGDVTWIRDHPPDTARGGVNCTQVAVV